MIECKYEVQPFPYRFCEGCVFNGCYPWNDSALILCSNMGGNYPAILDVEQDQTVRACESFQPVTEQTWKDHLSDEQAVAKSNERIRLYAMEGKVLSSELLPAERILRKRRDTVAAANSLTPDEMLGFIRNLDSVQHLDPKTYVIAAIEHYFTHVVYHDFPTEHGMKISQELLKFLNEHSAVNTKKANDWLIGVKLPSFRILFSRFFRKHKLTEETAQNLLQFIELTAKEAAKYE